MDNSDNKDNVKTSLQAVQIQASKADSVPVAPTAKRKIGRPKKRKSVSKPGPRKGDAAILQEYRARMLNSPKSRKVLDKVFEVALNDDHTHQAACMKMVMDRIIPAGAVANIAGSGGGKSAVTINITGIGEATVEPDGDTLDAEFEEL